MQKNGDLHQLSIEQLLLQKRKLTTASSVLSKTMIVLFVLQIHIAVENRNYSLLAIIPGCMMTLLLGYKSINELNNEIKNREEAKTIVDLQDDSVLNSHKK